MKIKMQDLDFEMTEVSDAQEFEFTRKAENKFERIVNLESFDDRDAEVIFNYLYHEMELVSFGDYLKRYIYEKARISRPFSSIPTELYRDIIIQSFKDTKTPKSMNPTSAKIGTLVNNWLNQSSVKRETVFLLGFGLRMQTEEVSEFLTKVLKEQDFDFRNPEEAIYWYCLSRREDYEAARLWKEFYQELEPYVEEEKRERFRRIAGGNRLLLDGRQTMKEYLAYVKAETDVSEESNQVFQRFLELLNQTKEIIAAIYQRDEDEAGGKKQWWPKDITLADVEKVICSGIPVNKMGNLKKMSASTLAKHFQQKRFSRQRIAGILNKRAMVERFDFITLEFFIISETMEDAPPYDRYQAFLKEINEILESCSMADIYIVNPYECFILMCLLTESPLAVFAEIWEMSYEENEP